MDFNVCETCHAMDGRAGNLFRKKGTIGPWECFNCYKTRETGNLVIDASLDRTDEEFKRTAAILEEKE